MAKNNEIAVISAKTADSADLAKSADSALLTEALIEFGVDASLPADLLIGQAVSAINAAERLNMAAGIALIQAKEKCVHGEFEKYLKSNGFETERAQEHMAIAAMLLKTKTEERAKLMRQGKTALIGLARMDDQVRQHWLDTGELDDVLTIHELKSKLAKQDKAYKALQADKDTLDIKIMRMEAQADLKVDAITPVTVAHLRKAAAGFGHEAIARLRAFEDLRARALELRGSQIDGWVQPVALQFIANVQMVLEAAQDELRLTIEAFGLEGAKLSAVDVRNAIPMVQETALIREHLNGIAVGFEMRRDDVRKVYLNAVKDDASDRGARYQTSEDKAAKSKKARG